MTIIKSFVALVSLSMTVASFAATPAETEADLILTGGKIHTSNGWAEALAVKRGVIVAVGDGEAVARYRTPATEVIELRGAAVVPGLHDMHVHPMGSGHMQRQCRFPQGSTPERIVDEVKACVAKRPKGEWINGGQWDAASFGKQKVHRSLLDKVSPDHPVALMDISIHAVWLNSKALELAGITRDTPDPKGGVIERDSKGVPTGVLRETARMLVMRVIPPPSEQENLEALSWALSYMMSYGITSFTDAAVDLASLRAYAALADQGKLKQRVRGCIGWRPSFGESETTADPIELRNLYARERFRPDCVKIALDGVPTEGHTAAMLEPYADAKATDARARGIAMVGPEQLKKALIEFDAQGLTVKMHAAGDAAVRSGLDAIQAAREANGFSGILHDLAHNSFVHMEDIRRARGLAATFEMSPYIWFPNPIIPDIAKAVGAERMQRWTPVKDAVEAGALVVPGSDWAVVPSVNPWLGIETLVTRQQPGGGGPALGDPITLQQAFNLYTRNAARQLGNASRTGVIAPGMLADMLVLDRNPFEIPVTQIHRTQVQLTIIQGEIVYRATGDSVTRATSATANSGTVMAQAPAEADLILTGGDVYTSPGWVEALAVSKGVIVAVGARADIDRYRTGKTKVIDLAGATVLPGLHDMHVHPQGAGHQDKQCRFQQGTAGTKVIEAVKACVAKRGKGQWVVGGQWDAASFGNRPPHRSQLDRVSPNNPVALTDISGHSLWANSKALALAGITASTPDPEGGIIERDAKGQPTGVLRESAGALVRRNIPAYTLEQNIEALDRSLQLMLSHGITSFTDAGVGADTMRAYAALADQQRLKQRVRGCMMWRPVVFNAGDAAPANYIEQRNLYARERFKPDCIKMVLDGVPTDGHTAAMLEPYADSKDPHDVRAKGLLLVPQETLNRAVTEFDAQGLTVKFHAAGDAAVRAGLDAIEAARKANGMSGPLHDVGHTSFADIGDTKRGRAIAATYEVSPYIWYPNPIIPDIAKAIGPERMQRWIPVKEILDSGALVVPGSDWPVVPQVNPWIGLETLVTRQQLGGGGEELGAVEKITMAQAIDLFTVRSARQMGNADWTGRIANGMLADVIVVDRNPIKGPATEAHQTKVKYTIIEGEVVYQAK